MNNRLDWDRLNRLMSKSLEVLRTNNTLRIDAIRSYGTGNLWAVFQLIPFLLHINHADFPGFIEADDVPRGVCGFENSVFLESARDSFPSLADEFEQAVSVERTAVQSLLLMGSSGSVGHTAASDLDYWVCINRRDFPGDKWEKFLRKLSAIEAWAQEVHSTEVHFYPVDLGDLSVNRFQRYGEETEGEVAPLLLKEEVYRTLVHVAGRMPLWWAVPPGTGQAAYRNIARGNLALSTDLIDLGFPDRPGPQEFLAAALWLSRKSEADPFKGALKMILVLEQVESGLKAPLLCHLLKKKVLTAEESELPVDPYALMIERVLGCAAEKLDRESLELIRLSVYYKVRGPFDLFPAGRSGPKARLLQKLISQWGWGEEMEDHYNHYSSWSERERLVLGEKMKMLLFNLYSRIARRLMSDYPDLVTSEDQNLAQLKAMIMARYSIHQAKVEELPSNLHRKTIPQSMTLVHAGDMWELFGGRFEVAPANSEESQGNLLYTAARAARVAVWLFHNRLYTPSMKLKLRPRLGPVSLEAILRFLDTLRKVFPPRQPAELDHKDVFRLGGEGPRLLALNFESPAHLSKIMSADLIFRTSWGEMRHAHFLLDPNLNEVEKIMTLAAFLTDHGHCEPSDWHFLAPDGAAGLKMRRNVQAALFQSLKGMTRQRSGLSKSARGLRLDID